MLQHLPNFVRGISEKGSVLSVRLGSVISKRRQCSPAVLIRRQADSSDLSFLRRKRNCTGIWEGKNNLPLLTNHPPPPPKKQYTSQIPWHNNNTGSLAFLLVFSFCSLKMRVSKPTYFLSPNIRTMYLRVHFYPNFL